MNFFEEVSSLKKDFPKVHTVAKDVKSYPLNSYQIFAIGIFILCFFLGIIFGNLFPTCQTTSYFYYNTNTCVVREFNFFLMSVIWFVSLLVSVFFFSLGHIISLLTQICKKIR